MTSRGLGASGSDASEIKDADARSPRLTRSARREQLLDTAAGLVTDGGVGHLTMERLARSAGVSKALPYGHFTNADDVLVGLYHRELALITERINAATLAAATPDDRLAAAIHAYFAVVCERGAILAALTGPTSPVPVLADPDEQAARRFVGSILEESHGLRGEILVVLTDILIGALAGAWSALGRSAVGVPTVEQLVTRFVLAGIGEIADASGSGVASDSHWPAAPRS